MPRSTSQQKIDRFFKTTPLAYQPGLNLIFGSSTGLFLYQLLYWCGKETRKDGWIYKTMLECQNEIGLSRSNQETAIKHLRRLGIIECKLAQVPAKRHFKVDMKRLEELLPEKMDNIGLVYLKPPSQLTDSQQSSLRNSSKLLQKTTQETTTKNNDLRLLKLKEEKKQLLEKYDVH